MYLPLMTLILLLVLLGRSLWEMSASGTSSGKNNTSARVPLWWWRIGAAAPVVVCLLLAALTIQRNTDTRPPKDSGARRWSAGRRRSHTAIWPRRSCRLGEERGDHPSTCAQQSPITPMYAKRSRPHALRTGPFRRSACRAQIVPRSNSRSWLGRRRAARVVTAAALEARKLGAPMRPGISPAGAACPAASLCAGISRAGRHPFSPRRVRHCAGAVPALPHI